MTNTTTTAQNLLKELAELDQDINESLQNINTIITELKQETTNNA
jgi:uncharacterized protein YoxC